MGKNERGREYETDKREATPHPQECEGGPQAMTMQRKVERLDRKPLSQRHESLIQKPGNQEFLAFWLLNSPVQSSGLRSSRSTFQWLVLENKICSTARID